MHESGLAAEIREKMEVCKIVRMVSLCVVLLRRCCKLRRCCTAASLLQVASCCCKVESIGIAIHFGAQAAAKNLWNEITVVKDAAFEDCRCLAP